MLANVVQVPKSRAANGFTCEEILVLVEEEDDDDEYDAELAFGGGPAYSRCVYVRVE